MKKIIGLSLALAMGICMIGGETFAYYTATETSSGNLLVSGTLKLKTNDADGVSQTLYATSMSPGSTVGPSSITLKNAGTINGATMDIVFSYTESDGSPNTVPESADEVAAMMEVIALNYEGTSLLSSISDINSNGYKDVYDLKNSNLTGLSGIPATASKNFDISVRLRSETGSDFQADGITIAMTFTLKQCAGSGYFSDMESSTNNILRIKAALPLGTADNFVILAGSTVTSTGNATVTGDLGLSPGTAVVGFPPGTVNGTIHAGDAAAAQAQIDLTTAYTDYSGRTPVTTLDGDTLGGLILTPGVYSGGSLGLTGTLTLTGDANAVWIIKAASALNTADGSQVILSGGAKAANVYWVVGSSATLGADSNFKGSILAAASITLNAGAALEGRALAQTGAVTLNANAIAKPAP